MDIRAVAFDVNGTLIDIRTDDGSEEAFRAVGHMLTYRGIDLRRHQLRDLWFDTMKRHQRASAELYPEFDSVAVWREIVENHATDYTLALPPEQLANLPLFLSEVYRGIGRRRLRLYPHVRGVLDILFTRLPLALVTDGQSSWARGELHRVGLLHYFDPIIISGDYGYRKPDSRLFEAAGERMGVAAGQTLYVGNDMHRDIYGAREAGMQTVMFDSDQGTKEYHGCVPDHVITDHRQLLEILQIPPA
jgi:putative hydrolase of the HAD superfamily